MKAIERATSTEYRAEKIEGGYEVYTLTGEKYKKLKDSTFKRYFKLQKDTQQNSDEPEVNTFTDTAESVQEDAETPQKDSKKSPKPKKVLTKEEKVMMTEKIKKILQLSKNNPSAEEGIAAALKAQELMAEYDIPEDDVNLEEINDDISSIIAEQKKDSNLHRWRFTLANTVAKNFRVKCYVDQNRNVVFRGYRSDAQIAQETFLYLYTLGDKLGSKEYKKAMNELHSGKGVYNNFVIGFTQGIEDALSEQCKALMLVTPKVVEEEFRIFSADMQNKKQSLNFSHNKTYEKGLSEGKSAVKSRQLKDKKSKKA